MITTLTMNPCIDRTITVNTLHCGETNHITSVRQDPSGKGINVSLALRNMGMETMCLSYDHTDGMLRHFLEQKEIPHKLVSVPGSIRMNIKIFDKSSRSMTECNESGCALSADDVSAVYSLVGNALSYSTILVLNGSVPPGVADDFYRVIIEMSNKADVPVLFDASGAQLREGIMARPLLIKPNKFELETTFGLKLDTLQMAACACSNISEKYGIRYVCCSLGAEGALLVSGKDAWFSSGAQIQVRGIQGAGDSMIAGFCAGLSRGITDGGELLRLAVATAHASLELEGTQMCDAAGVNRMLSRIKSGRLDF